MRLNSLAIDHPTAAYSLAYGRHVPGNQRLASPAASASRPLYTGVTSNLERRVREHREKVFGGFTARSNINRLVYCETCGDVVAAIAREKQIKSWRRLKKIALIESANRDWKDLSDGWFGKKG
ncbi:MAG TPA: GIY-YIG nuclease family protein [Terriglobia bacterium]|jgi:putative endonuclease|nr:GIY-YIG nuclease family protein [Terriglobia bacterium]